ncbi:MAG: aminopeptidase [Spirochaetales bacterium]|nr:aminopeptidase [Spirochaetales bacterium]
MNNKEKYADLLVRTGINLKNNQLLVINSPVECADFTRLVTEKAYEAGAKEVFIRWNDEKSDRIRFNMGPDEIFDNVNSWDLDFLNSTVNQDAAYLRISASDPELMKDVDPKRMARQSKAITLGSEYYRSRLMSNQNVWCVASIPTESWAKKVFPNEKNSIDSVNKLWDAIFKAVRVDTPDPVQAWKEHQDILSKRKKFLNDSNFKSLNYKNSLGTNVTVELVENHIWFGGGEESSTGQHFIANMPTEEIFSMPKKDGINGKIVSSLPLNYHGNLIRDFYFVFKDGLIVEFDAKEGRDVLEELLQTDEGAKRLGEVALVPYDSPISNSKTIFYNTLFDENASCHFALGRAYPINIKNGENMNKEEMNKAGVNDSLVHVDFMVGSSDLEITGIKDDGTEIPVFVNGNFVL